MIPEFQPKSIVAQVADFLRTQIEDGLWSSWIPTERDLADRLRVSRGTIRAALAVLARERLVETRHGLGTVKIAQARSRAKPRGQGSRPITLLMPEPLSALRPYLTIWIDTLKSLLFDSGYALHLQVRERVFQRNGDRQLGRLIEQHPSSCWILALSNAAVQRWFETNKVPCVVLGEVSRDVRLPCVALDLKAVCRHAAGELLRLGHRRLALVSHRAPSPGAVEAADGFCGVVAAHGADASVELILGDDDVDHLCRKVTRLVKPSVPITGFMVLNPLVYVAVQSACHGSGMRIPEDVSLMTTYGDPFMAYVRPTVARYAHHPTAFARRLHRLVLRCAAGNAAAENELIVPEFVSGKSLGPAPAGD